MQWKPWAAALLAGSALASRPVAAQTASGAAFRPPAVPLVTHDPYLSVWSEADRLTDDATRHWTGRPHPLVSLIRIDGKTYRLMGDEPQDAPALPQRSVQVLPTRSVYEFGDARVRVTLTFMTTALPDDLDALTRPLTYLTWRVRSVDGKPHAAALYDSVGAVLAANMPDQSVKWSRETMGPLTALRAGTVDQPVLESSGDNHRIDWGYIYLAAPRSQARAAIGGDEELLRGFAERGSLPAQDDRRMPRAANDDPPTLAVAFDLGKVGAAPVSRHAIVAYDEIYSIKYYGTQLRPYWRRNGATPSSMLQAAERDYSKLAQRCETFDRQLMADLTRAGGTRYARIAALSYRQALAATGIAADANRQPLLFTKENTSNGDIATVDVFFPMDPMLILFSPTLAKASLVPILAYSASPHWKFPNAPHDLGTYPIVTGRDDGGEGMPVEESGNMLILCDAVAHEEGNAKFVAPWWPQLTRWAKYLENYGLDPENQLCTDDFMGHLAHNANLSVKAILGLAAYGDLCRMRGDAKTAKRYADLAKADAKHWIAVADAGNHSLLAFDKPGTWSQKYNLVWDRILGLNVFPPAVARKEIAYYKSVMQPYGVPLDSRTRLTKTDWSVWSATMAENPADFRALVSPIYDYLNATSSRQPLVDSYVTDNLGSSGMHARPVVGGTFIKLLSDPALWKKWSSRDRAKVGGWAPLPPTPTYVIALLKEASPGATWRYATERPSEDWRQPGYDDSSWAEGKAGFGTRGTPNAMVGTLWDSRNIWLRRQVTLPAEAHSHLQFLVYHDEDAEIYVNGVLASRESGFTTGFVPMRIRPAARAFLKPGATVTLAVHCRQTGGGQNIDVALADVTIKPAKPARPAASPRR
jgi:hypothetical protein